MFYIGKSVRLIGPLRLNVSNRGVGLSLRAGGVRIPIRVRTAGARRRGPSYMYRTALAQSASQRLGALTWLIVAIALAAIFLARG